MECDTLVVHKTTEANLCCQGVLGLVLDGHGIRIGRDALQVGLIEVSAAGEFPCSFTVMHRLCELGVNEGAFGDDAIDTDELVEIGREKLPR